jgi:hypothetical protein
MPGRLEEKDWTKLLERIRDKRCTPFVGAGACAGTLPLASQIACQWAERYKYPLTDFTDLARVSQFLAIDHDDDMFAKEEVKRQFARVSPPDFSAPNEPHGLLADLDLPIYLTTNYDSFMFQGLQSRGRDPRRELCRWNRHPELNGPSVFDSDYSPTSECPLVYHLHGHLDVGPSMVLTEDDYLDFLVRLSIDQKLLPSSIVTALAGTSLLFIGYSLADWNFRVLCRSLIGSLGASLGMKSVAVQLPPSSLADPSELGRARAQTYLDQYLAKIQKIKLCVYWGDVKDFTQELRQRWEDFRRG